MIYYCFVQIVSAVQYCHQKHIVHRDLKVSSCLFSCFLYINNKKRDDMYDCIKVYKCAKMYLDNQTIIRNSSENDSQN